MKKIKPREIVTLEKQFNIVISEFSNLSINNKNYYMLADDKKIISLSLIHNQISNISFLENFPFLESLDLSFNQIINLSGVENLRHLKNINLSGNQISDIIYIGKLINLKSLILKGNFISDASCLTNLSSLNYLNLGENQISELNFLCEMPELLELRLNNNIIDDILCLENLKKIQLLHLNNNHIYNISVLENFKEIKYLNLSDNEITDISYLEKLTELINLNLSKNEIHNAIFLKDLVNLRILYLTSNIISDIYFLEYLVNLEILDLANNKIEDISILKQFDQLYSLDLSHNLIKDISSFSNFPKISRLYLYENNGISDILVLKELKTLTYLNLSSNKNIKDFSTLENLNELRSLLLNNVIIQDFSFLEKLKNIETLFLGSNKISNVSFLRNIKSLQTLYLNFNNISNIDALSELKNITSLYLQGNKISNILKLKDLVFLNLLDLTNNLILEIEQFEFISNLTKLNIRASHNPCFNNNQISLDEKNNYDTILNALKKNKESKRKYNLPAKVLFLGNTQSGKSTLLDYILQDKEPRIIKDDLHSTHIVQIETLPKKIRKNIIPKAVFYDFGGQDYYHGLYKAFLSNDSINILLWNSDYDKNQIRKDRNSQLTRDYNRDYWLNQLKFQYNRSKTNKGNLELKKEEPILLVQTHADVEKHKRENYKGDCESFNIKNEFFISLNDESVKESTIHTLSLKYLEETLKDLITKKQIIKNEPRWYKDFLNFILRTSKENYILLSEIALEYKRESDPENLLLPEVLRELSQTGLVLYYKDDPDLKDVVWLDPSKTIQYIHDSILSKDNIIAKKGIVERNILDDFEDQKLVKLLINQKVIFLDEYDNKYIIPGYLPLTEEEDKLYELLTFDFIEPTFILKFEYFIPFGLINQLICFYGKNRNKKHYWRDQLLFTKDNCKILIKLDFTNLEISVSIKSKENKSFDRLQKEIFKDIINLYWDKVPKKNIEKENIIIEDINIENLIDGKLKASITHKDIKAENIVKAESRDSILADNDELVSPEDLYISIDNKYFTNHKDLQNEDKTFSKVISFGLEIKKEIQNDKEIEIRRFNKNLVIEESAILFRNFANNKNTEKMKKIFISYSKFDDDYKREFVKHLITLKDENLIDPFNCDEIDLGEDSHEVIQRKLGECDYMVALVSVDLLNTKYIRDFEVDKAEELGKKIIPIIIKPCDWETSKLGKHHASLRGTNISLDKKLYLDGDIKEVSKIERAAFWTAVIKEFREKLFN